MVIILSAKFIERVVKNLEIKRRRRHSCRYNVIALLRTICLQFLITYNSFPSMESFCSKIFLDFQSSSILFRRITFVSTPLEASKSPPRDSFCFIFLRPSVLEIRPFKDRLNFEYLSSFLSRSLVPLAPLSLVTLTYPTAHWRAESAFFSPSLFPRLSFHYRYYATCVFPRRRSGSRRFRGLVRHSSFRAPRNDALRGDVSRERIEISMWKKMPFLWQTCTVTLRACWVE